MANDHQAKVRAIIAENEYMTVATTDGHRPWLAPVQFCCDEQFNFYFVSLPTSRHAEHIGSNPNVGLAIFDSQQPPFTSRGVQVEGVATRYSDEENPFATIGGLDMPAELQQILPGYAAFRVEAKRFYVPRAYLEGNLRDERLEVSMSSRQP